MAGDVEMVTVLLVAVEPKTYQQGLAITAKVHAMYWKSQQFSKITAVVK